MVITNNFCNRQEFKLKKEYMNTLFEKKQKRREMNRAKCRVGSPGYCVYNKQTNLFVKELLDRLHDVVIHLLLLE